VEPGLIVAPLTPFTAGLDVDEAALRREIDYVVSDCRATMVVAAGVETQEYTYLSLEQRKALHRGLAPVMKAAMKLIGVPVGDPYPPYASLSDDEIKAMAAVLRTTVLAERFSVTAAA